MSVSLSAERDRIQRQVEELEQSLSATNTELQLLSSETDDESDGDDSEEERQSAAGLLAQREKIQEEIQNLENMLGPHSPACETGADDSSSEESELGLSASSDSCLQMNLVYQQVLQETLEQLETLLTNNHRQQKELVSQLSGPIKEAPREQPAPSSCQQPFTMYLGRFLKPYFKDKLTGLGPPANQEAKEKASRMTGCLDDKKLKIKRWESWQKTLLIHSVSRDSLRKLIQPKLSKMDYLSQKLSSAAETDRQPLRHQIDSLERDIELLRGRTEEELIGDRYDEHDWQKISNIDFEATRDAEDIRSFWQNFLHPSVRKTQWSKEEVQQLREVSGTHAERHWETIAAELGTGRTAFLCLQTFQRFVSGSLKRGSWTAAEDALLRELVDKMRIGNFIPYTQMSYFMEGRDPAQLIYRWNQVLDPSLKKGFWTGEEDELLLQAVSRHGEKDWWKIRLEVPGRTDSGCRDRYYDCLKAETKKGPFDQQEKGLLLVLVQKHGVGRWARIAAEIPHRNDAQCLREWRKLNKPAAPPRDKKDRKPPRSRGGGAKTQTKEDAPAKKRIRRPLTKVKEEVEEVVQVESSEDETMVVEYMDSDEEEKKEKRQEIVEEVEEYTLSPMQEWIPVEKAQCSSFPAFRPVELPSSGAAHSQVSVRSTILGPFGLSVIFGPQPRELPREERHSSSMMMVSADQLQAHLHRQASKFNCPSSGPRRKVHTEKQNPLGRGMDMGLSYELQAAVTPWIGNLLILQKHRLTTADALRQRREKTRLPSTPVFLLLLQTLNVDATGCKDMIEQRRNRVVSLVPPPPCPPSVRTNTVAGMLQQRKLIKEEQEFDLQQKWILKQLQALQQRPQQLMLVQQLMLLQQPPSSPRPPATPSQNCPGVLLQMPLNMSPQMFPQAVIIPHPVTQPRAASMQLMPPFSLNTLPPAVGAVASPLPAHPAPQRLSVPPVSVVPLPLNAASTCSDSPPQEAVPLPPHQHLSAGCTLPGQHTAPSSSPVTNPRRARPASSPSRSISRSPKGKGQQAACSSVIKERQRSRRPSQKAKALQEAKAEAKKKEASSRLKRAPIQSPVPSATQNLSLAPAHSITTNQHTALPANFHNDHDYTSLNLHPGQRGSIKPTPLPSKKPPKAPSSGRKRGSGGQPSMTSSQGDQCVGGTGTGVIQKEKRVRNLTQRARALQEDTQAKAEAKKKRTPSPPRKKCSRTSRPKEEVVTQNRPVAPPPSGFCLQPGQSMWVMTPGGLVQLAQALPHSLQLPLVPSGPLPAPPTTAPLRLTTGGPRSIAPQPSSAFSVSLRKEALQFDPSLMFLESQEAVRDWLSGRGGVAVPGAGTALPYLPPFVSSLSALSALLRAKKSLTKTSLQLLSRGSEPRRPTTKLDGTERTPMLPDSTSDLRAARDAAAPSVSSNVLQAEEEAELVAVARQLVTERFSGNPAYQLLKARFLSCFTVPALLATVQPIGEKTVAGQADEEEEEEEVKKIKERGRQRRVERSLLLCDGPGAPANHFSGICTNTAGPDQ